MTETKQQVTGNIAHTNIEPYNENNSTHINNVGPDDGPRVAHKECQFKLRNCICGP